MGLPIWARWIRSRGATKDDRRRARRAGHRRRRGDPARATSSCSTPTASPSSPPSAPRRCWRRRCAREEKEARQAREAPGGRAVLRARRARRGRRGSVTDIAHLGPVELFTPTRRGEPALLRRRDGHGDRGTRTGRPTYLRGWGDYQRWSLKLTASDTSAAWACSGCAPGARRRSQRRVAAVEATGLGEGWTDGDRGRGPVVPLPRPGRPPLRALLRVRALRPAAAPAPGAQERARPLHRPRLRGQAPRPRQRPRRRRAREPRLLRRRARLPPVRADRARRRQRGRRLDERVDRRPRADLHARRARRPRPPAPPRVLGRHARGVPARRRHLARRRDRDRGRAVQARDRAGLLPLRDRAGRQPRSRSPPAGASSTTPTSRASSGPRRSAPRARRGACKTVESFHTYGTPPV